MKVLLLTTKEITEANLRRLSKKIYENFNAVFIHGKYC